MSKAQASLSGPTYRAMHASIGQDESRYFLLSLSNG